MASNPALRLTLGDLHGLFEAACQKAGISVSRGLARVVATAVEDRVTIQPRASPLFSLSYASPEEQEQFAALAEESGLPLATYLRALVRASLESGGLPKEEPLWTAPALESQGLCETRTARLELRLTPSEISLLQRQADQAGFRSVQDLVIRIIRSHLLHGVVVGPRAATALGEQNLHLIRIAQEIRHLARHEGVNGDNQRDRFQGLVSALEAHVSDSSALLAQARKRWALKPGAQEEAE